MGQQIRVNINDSFVCRKSESASEATLIICQKQKKDFVSQNTYYNWYKKFDLGIFGTENKSYSGRPNIVNYNQLKKYITVKCLQKSYFYDFDYGNKKC